MSRAHLSAAFTVLCALVLAGFVVFLGWLHVTGTVFDTVSDPERALDLIVGRTLDLHDAMEQAVWLERRLYELGVSDGEKDLPQAIDWYDELARVSLDPGVDLRLAILRGEDDELDEIAQMVAAWPGRGPPFDGYAALVAAAYLDGPLAEAPPAEQVLPAGWFQDRVRVRLAERTADAARAAAARADEAARGARLRGRMRVLVAAMVAALVAAVVAAVALVRHPRPRVASAPRPPSWTWRDGVVVLIRGGAAAAVLALALVPAGPWIGSDSALLEVIGIPLMNVPLLWVARGRLLTPVGQTFRAAFGLAPDPGRGAALALTAVLLIGSGVVIDLLVGELGDALGAPSHWTEWFDADLAWGRPAMVAATLLSTVTFAPIFEELAFRGLLYGTLRRGLSWPAAATLSAAVFALAHGYGTAGLASVFLSGALWAIAYEATGSVLPGMIAHAANNLSASLTVLWLLR